MFGFETPWAKAKRLKAEEEARRRQEIEENRLAKIAAAQAWRREQEVAQAERRRHEAETLTPLSPNYPSAPWPISHDYSTPVRTDCDSTSSWPSHSSSSSSCDSGYSSDSSSSSTSSDY